MSTQIVFLVVGAVLLVHGIAHVGPIGAYIWIKTKPGDNTSGWLAARSWLFPSLPPTAATVVASVFWALCIIGFVAAALSFWGIIFPGEVWRQLAIASALVSSTGIVLFFGTWPIFNTIAALAVNVTVLVTQLWLHWPSAAMMG
jgi:hypothetical protein